MARPLMPRPHAGRFILFAAFLALLPLILGFNFPQATGFVTDSVGLLTPGDRAALETELKGLEKDTGWEVAVVTVSNLEGATVERYAQDMFVSYGIGKKGTDNGVLLLVARQDRKVRIHTGYHAESVVTDAVAKRIISEVIAPKTKAEDWSGGITDGARSIVKLIRDPAHNPATAVGKPAADINFATIILIIFIAVIAFVILMAILRKAGGSGFSSGGFWDSDDSGGDSGFGGFGGGDSGGGGASGDC